MQHTILFTWAQVFFFSPFVSLAFIQLPYIPYIIIIMNYVCSSLSHLCRYRGIRVCVRAREWFGQYAVESNEMSEHKNKHNNNMLNAVNLPRATNLAIKRQKGRDRHDKKLIVVSYCTSRYSSGFGV